MIADGKSTLNLMGRRQSVRKYLADPIDRVSVDRCIEAARLAPSANNGQPWEFVVVADEVSKTHLAQAARFGLLKQNPFAAEAPVIVAVLETSGHRATSWGGRLLGQNFPLMDIGMAVENFCVQAAAEGLGTCIMGLFAQREARRAIKAPINRRVRLLIALGRPAEQKIREKKRHSKETISRYIEGRGITNGS